MGKGKPHSKDTVMEVFAGVAVIALLLFMFAPDSLWNRSTIAPAAKRPSVTEITAPDMDGNVWRLSEHRGKVVLVNYWATWCPPCRQETPGLVRIARELAPQGLEVVGVSLDETRDAVPPFIASYKIPYRVLLPNSKAAFGVDVESIPTTLLVDKEGRIAKTYVGAVAESTFKKDIEQLLLE